MTRQEEIYDRMTGCLYGQAVGDALGLCSEFKSKHETAECFSPMLRYYSQFYPSGLGVWQDDDTKQMLCLLEELTANGRIEAVSLAARLLNWLETDGFGCGNLVYQVLTHRDYLNSPFDVAKERWELSGREAAPNGAIMRTAVIGLWRDNVENNAVTACKVTHADPRCIGSSVIVSLVINNLVWHGRELSYDEIVRIADGYDPRIGEWIAMAKNGTLEDLGLDEPHSIATRLRSSPVLCGATGTHCHLRTDCLPWSMREAMPIPMRRSPVRYSAQNSATTASLLTTSRTSTTKKTTAPNARHSSGWRWREVIKKYKKYIMTL